MKTVILCRHAKSDWPEMTADIDRPLKERGKEDAAYLAGLLADQQFVPDLIISSPARRAQETAEIYRSKLGYSKEIRTVRSVYYEELGSLIQMIQGVEDEVSSLMVFGHNPTMENAVRYLLQMDTPFDMPTCGMACFESLSNQWKSFGPRQVYLRWLLIPRLKRKD
ncbi:MAG: histidine phosphatase family protein [Bacteroidota bacterium]